MDRKALLWKGPLLPSERLVQLLDQTVLPSIEMLAQWEKEGIL